MKITKPKSTKVQVIVKAGSEMQTTELFDTNVEEVVELIAEGIETAAGAAPEFIDRDEQKAEREKAKEQRQARKAEKEKAAKKGGKGGK